MFLSVGQAPKPRILYWKPQLPYTAILYNAFQKNKKAAMARLHKQYGECMGIFFPLCLYHNTCTDK